MGMYRNFLHLERHCRVDRECLHGDGHSRKFKQGLSVPGCVLRGGVVHAEHGKDVVLGESPSARGWIGGGRI